MEIFVTNYGGDNRKIGKGISDWTSLGGGSLRDPSDVINPVILVERNLINFNYVSIPAFSRYYFVTEVRMIRQNLMEIHLHVDVLYSHVQNIMNLHAVSMRSADASTQSPYLYDAKRPIQSYQVYRTYELFTFHGMGANAILVTAG